MYVVESLQKQWYIGEKLIKIKVPKNVAYIIGKLNESGYEAFAVGGCVRDAVLGLTPHDWDITTSAKPEEVKAIFNRTIDTGIKHGTVTVMRDHIGYEITTYRIDGEYTDGRHPKEVVFTSNLVEDLKRRDFTINAMAYNDEDGIIDEFGGVSDLENHIIRCVGVAEERFNEDALRILRAIRFAAKLDFSIEENTYAAIKKIAPNLSLISVERIQSELTKLITSDHPDRIKDIYRQGLSKYIFKESVLGDDEADVVPKDNKYSKEELFERVANIMGALENSSYLRYAGLLTFENNPEKVLRNLKMDNKTIKIVSKLVNNRNYGLIADEGKIRRAIVDIGKDIFGEYYLPYREGLILSKESDMDIEELKIIKCLYEKMIVEGQCVSMADMCIKGNDLKNLGVQDGKMIGEILKYLFNEVIEDSELNDSETLIRLAKNKIDDLNVCHK